MNDDPITVFRRRVFLEAADIRKESSTALLLPDPASGDPPSRYFGLYRELEHFVRSPTGALRAEADPIPIAIHFPDDYCSCADGTLQLRVARVLKPIAHPNIGPAGTVCLGGRFRGATRLRPLLEHLHRILSGRSFAAESPFDPNAAEWFRRHPERVRALRAAPLWRRRVAESVRVALDAQTRGGTR